MARTSTKRSISPDQVQAKIAETAARSARRSQPASGTAANAGFAYPNAPQSPTTYRAPQPDTDRRNTYERPQFSAAPTSSNPYQQSILNAMNNRKSDLTNAADVALRQIASDKAFSYDTANIGRTAQQNAYQQGVQRSDIDQAAGLNTVDSRRNLDINALNAELTNQRSGYALNDELARIQQRQDQSGQKSLFSNLGTLAGSQFNNARILADNLFGLNRSAERERNLGAEQRILGDITGQERYYGGERQRVMDTGMNDRTGMSNQLADALAQIQARQDQSNRETFLAGQEVGNRLSSGVNEVGVDQANALYSFDQDAQKQAQQAKDDELARQYFALQEANITGSYRGAPTQAAGQRAFENSVTQAGLTGMYGGSPTFQARTQQDQLREAIYQRMNAQRQQDLENTRADRQLGLQQQQIEANIGKSSFTPQETMEARMSLAQVIGQSIATGASPSGSGFQLTRSPEEIGAYINSIAGGNSLAAQKLRSELAQYANTLLAQRGIKAVISPAAGTAQQRPSIEEYEYARRQGYTGSFIDFVAGRDARAKRALATEFNDQ